MNKEIRNHLITKIKSAPSLPERFYKIHTLIYTGSLDKSYLQHFFHKTIENNYIYDCPCKNASYTALYGIDLILLTFYVEDQTTQKDCLNYCAENSDFLNKIEGIKNATIFYYGKKLEELDDTELIEIIIMMENPSLYNKKRHPERLQQRVDKILQQLNRF